MHVFAFSVVAHGEPPFLFRTPGSGNGKPRLSDLLSAPGRAGRPGRPAGRSLSTAPSNQGSLSAAIELPRAVPTGEI
jgi:hypothetical protein